MSRRLIVTADDFGLNEAVNAAVDQAAAGAVLSAASLMVGAPAAAQAVQIARRHPQLRIGLHLVLTDGCSVLSQRELPALVGRDRRFRGSMVRDAFGYLYSASRRAQARAEIRAQFDAFHRTGLLLDHVNTHKHFHMHPILLNMILNIAREYASPAMRLPAEPLWFSSRAGFASVASTALLWPWIAWMRLRYRARGIAYNDRIFGISCSGALDAATLLSILERLPAGTSEVYLHPTQHVQPDTGRAEELDTLLDRQVIEAVKRAGIIRGGFCN